MLDSTEVEPPSGGGLFYVARELDSRAGISELHRLIIPGASEQREVRVFCRACLFPLTVRELLGRGVRRSGCVLQDVSLSAAERIPPLDLCRVRLRGYALSPGTEVPGYVRWKPAEAGWVLASDAPPGVSAFRITSTCYVFRQGSRLQAAICFPVAQRFDLRAEGRCRKLTCFRSPVAACGAAIWETVLVSTGVFNGRQRKRLLFVRSGVNAAADQRRVRLCGCTGAEAVSCRLSFCWGFGFPAGAAGGVVRPFLAIIVRRCWG